MLDRYYFTLLCGYQFLETSVTKHIYVKKYEIELYLIPGY